MLVVWLLLAHCIFPSIHADCMRRESVVRHTRDPPTLCPPLTPYFVLPVSGPDPLPDPEERDRDSQVHHTAAHTGELPGKSRLIQIVFQWERSCVGEWEVQT